MKPKRVYKQRSFCSISEGSCLNPAGYRCGGGALGNPDGPRITWECPACGNPTCKKCRKKNKGRTVCAHCAEGI